MTTVYLAVEGRTDAPVAQRLVQLVGLRPQEAVIAGGKSELDPRIPSLNRSGAHMNWLILRDLDCDSPCPSQLIHRLLKARTRSPRVALRVPVRAVESWMLADVDGFAQEFSVSRRHVPRNPDDLTDPKQSLVDCCRRSRQLEIRTAMAPRGGSGRKVGPEYAHRISSFSRRLWHPERASERSPSLRRTIAALHRQVTKGIWT